MKVAVITRHAISNYGSLLQTYATQKVLKKLGYECEIIDYIRDDESYFNNEKTLLKQKPNWYNNPIKRYMYLFLRKPESVLSGRMFEKERRKYLKLTRHYESFQALKEDCPKADIYMTGSDQVWGPTADGTHDPAYCLAFTPDNMKQISYAASFGRTKMTDQIMKFYAENLERYTHLSVREDSAVEIIERLGLNAEQVLDPTLLLTASEWRKLIKTPINKKYILIYQLHNDSRVDEYAKKVAEKSGLSVIRLSTSLHQIIRFGKFIWNPDIEKFLSYIDQAECLITDSFHGTAFAINFNTKFVEILPNNNTGTRNQSILRLTGLEDRILRDMEDVDLAFKPIEFEEVNKNIEIERRKSLSKLKIMLEE